MIPVDHVITQCVLELNDYCHGICYCDDLTLFMNAVVGW